DAVFRLVDRAHAAPAKQSQDAIARVGDELARHVECVTRLSLIGRSEVRCPWYGTRCLSRGGRAGGRLRQGGTKKLNERVGADLAEPLAALRTATDMPDELGILGPVDQAEPESPQFLGAGMLHE